MHLVAATGTPVGSVLGALTAVKNTDTTGSGTGGQLTWNYRVAASAVEYLAAGQTKVESFTITLDDQNGGLVTRQIDVTITGTNDAPIVTAQDLIGAVTEALTPSGNLTDSGTIAFGDVDLADVNLVSASGTPVGSVLGSLTAVKNTDTTGSGTGGQLTWTYRVAAADVEYLAAGQTKVESFTITLDDQNGGLITRQIDVTITGTNDVPIVTSEQLRGDVSEAPMPVGTIEARGGIEFTDVDLADVHGVSPTGTPLGRVLGSLIAVKAADSTGSGAGGRVEWTYSVAAADVEFLAAGESTTDSFLITLDDGEGGFVERRIDVTISGLNHAPVVTSEDLAGAVTEADAPSGRLADSGFVRFADVDLRDVHRVTPVGTPVGPALGTLVASLAAQQAGGGEVRWTYSVAAADIEYLAAGETRTERFEITIDDPHGGAITRLVEVTITGTNDAPLADAQALGATVVEATEPTGRLGASGRLDFSDADFADVHRVIVAPVAANVLGTLTANIDADSTGGVTGRVGWTYSVAAADVETLAAGETKTETFTIRVEDGRGGVLARELTVTLVGSNDAPVVIGGRLSGELIEPTAPTGSLTASGEIRFADADIADVHRFPSIGTAVGQTLGSLSLVRDSAATTPGQGQLLWTYQVASADLEYLAAGETRIERFDVRIDDPHGGGVTQRIEITLRGSNDAPVVVSEQLTASLIEPVTPQGELGASGRIAFGDVDATDIVAVTPAGVAVGTPLGKLAASIEAATAGSPARVVWNYTVAAADLERLAAGENLVERFDITLDDGAGGVLVRRIEVTLTGSNDAPVLIGELQAQPATEGSAFAFRLPTPSFADVDNGDRLAYAASLADGRPLPDWLLFDPATQGFTGRPPLGSFGILTIRITATDAAGAIGVATFALDVAATRELLDAAAAPTAPAAPTVAATTITTGAAPVEAADAPALPSASVRTIDSLLPVDDFFARSAANTPILVTSPLIAAPSPRSSLGSASDLVLAQAVVADFAGLQLTPFMQTLQSSDLLRKLDEIQRQVEEQATSHQSAVAASVAITTGLSVGYVIWLVRGGLLLSSVLSAMPAWQMIDPLPVLTRSRGLAGAAGDDDDEEGGEGVEKLFGGRTPTPDAAAGIETAGTTSAAVAAARLSATAAHRNSRP